jgi:predicted AAA+ superfamily ATPase
LHEFRGKAIQNSQTRIDLPASYFFVKIYKNFLLYAKYGGMPAVADYGFDEKIILSQDKNFISSYDGIEIKNVIDFLLE